MVDIHSHILYGIDDGAKNIEVSREMLELAIESGTTALVATPHSDLRYRYDRSTVEARLEELRQFARGRIELHAGCDFHLSYENMRGALQAPGTYTINSGRYLLVEFPEDQIVRNTPDLLRALLDAGIVPIITHPERNAILRGRLSDLKDWISAGCLIQVTAQCLFGKFGRSAQASANQLIQNGMVHFLASDAHDTRSRPPGLADAFDLVAARWGESAAMAICRTNPGAVIADLDVPLEAPQPKPVKRWFFLPA